MRSTANGFTTIGRVGARLLNELCSVDFERCELGVCKLLEYSHIEARLANGVEVHAG